MPRQISLFRELTAAERSHLLQVGIHIWLAPGEMLFRQGEPAKYFYIVLEGAIRISRQIDKQEIVLATYSADCCFGEIPLLAGTPHLTSGQAVSCSHLYSLPEDEFWQMFLLFLPVRKAVLNLMASRLQELVSLSHNREKLIALGTLAAGLAHELNNPVSAARQAVEQLRHTMQKRHSLALRQIKQYLTPNQLDYLLELKHQVIERVKTSSRLDPLTQINLEDELAPWLDEHGITDQWQLVSTLVAAGVTTEQLAVIGKQVAADDTLIQVLTWLETNLTEASLLNVLEHSTKQIFELVNAVKAYSYLDRAIEKKPTDLHAGLENTLTILSYKLRKYQIVVVREYAQNVPKVQANGSSLNQVWTNLIDNAIDVLGEHSDASAKCRTLRLRTTAEKDYVVVEIADNGSGIPPEIQSRLFEPFFTTKEVGKGTGIGLDLSYRIVVGEHNGKICCFSQPGCTRFSVYLPI